MLGQKLHLSWINLNISIECMKSFHQWIKTAAREFHYRYLEAMLDRKKDALDAEMFKDFSKLSNAERQMLLTSLTYKKLQGLKVGDRLQLVVPDDISVAKLYKNFDL